MPEHILIATLGRKPQLITLALDCLREQGVFPHALMVVHTDARRPATAAALQRLQSDLPLRFPSLEYRSLELSDQVGPLADVTAPDEVALAFRALYAEVRAAKLSEQTVHLLIAGGRRTFAVFGMAVAQMLFDDSDRLWHLASHPALEESERLHAGPGEWARLIPIPVITWGRLSPAFDALRAVDDPAAAAERLAQLRLREQWEVARNYIRTKLSPGELPVVELLIREDLNQQAIAGRLGLSARTVEQHLRSAYRKAADHWELADVNHTQLVRLLSLYFSLKA